MKDGYCYKCKTFYARYYRKQPHSCMVVDPTTQAPEPTPIMSERRRYTLWRAMQKRNLSTGIDRMKSR